MSLGVEKASIDLGRIFIWFWLELLQFWKEINSFGRKGPIGCETEPIHFETRSRDKESNWTGLNKPKPQWIHFLWKSNDLLPKSNGFLSQSIWCPSSMDFLANEIKWGGHQFYFGRAIIWYGKKNLLILAKHSLDFGRWIIAGQGNQYIFVWFWYEADRNSKRTNWILKGT